MPINLTVLSSLGDFTPNALLGVEASTVTATTTAVTINAACGTIVTAALTTAAGATYTLTVSNSFIGANDMVFAALNGGSSTTGSPVITTSKVTAGQVVFIIQNIHASAALNGTLSISFLWVPYQ